MNNATLKRLALAIIILLSTTAGVVFYHYHQADFETIQGDSYRWQSLKGKWVVVNYFAPWCAPCLREMPELHRFNTNLPPHIKLFAINYDTLSIPELREMLNKFEISLDVIVAGESTRLPINKPPYLPATYIIGPQGNVRAELLGEVTAQTLNAKLAELQAL